MINGAFHLSDGMIEINHMQWLMNAVGHNVVYDWGIPFEWLSSSIFLFCECGTMEWCYFFYHVNIFWTVLAICTIVYPGLHWWNDAFLYVFVLGMWWIWGCYEMQCFCFLLTLMIQTPRSVELLLYLQMLFFISPLVGYL